MSVSVLSHLYRRSVERKVASRDLSVELSSRDGGGWPTLVGRVLDESARGVRVTAPRLISIGELVLVRVAGRVEAPARVIWCGEGNEGFELGLEFVGRSAIAVGGEPEAATGEQESGHFPSLRL